MSNLIKLADLRVDDEVLETVDGGFFNSDSRSTTVYGPRNTASGNRVYGDNNIVSGRDTNVH